MRDKNLTLLKFNIQLEKAITSQLRGVKLLRIAVSDSPKLLDNEEFSINYPFDFNGLRTLAIFQWSFPEKLHWRVLLDLKEKTHSQLNEKQKLELSILLSSKEICYFYLYETERYSSREIFGNILGNQARELFKTLKVQKKIKKRVLESQRSRGYRDKGNLRPKHQWLESYDFSFTEYQNKLEKKSYLQTKCSHNLKQLLTEKLRTLQRKELISLDNIHLTSEEKD